MINDNLIGHLPPQALDLEQAMLGSMMNHESALFNVIDFLLPEHFYNDAHQKIYSSIRVLYEKHQPVDELTVITQLRKDNLLDTVGGVHVIAELSRHTRNNWDFNSKIIFEKYLARETIRISTDAIASAYDPSSDVFEVIEKNQSETLSLTHNKTTKQSRKINDLIASCRADYVVPVLNGITGIPTGLTEVDRITHGWQNGELIVIGARPAMGKTAFVLQCAKHPAIKLNKPVVIFSLEMSDVQLTNRLISSETDTHIEKLITHNLSEDDYARIDSMVGPLNDSPLIIDDSPGLSIFDFRAKCRRLKAQHDIQLVIVDYLQLMDGKKDVRNGNREQEIGSISRTLKLVAKELNVPVIALSQLSRALESRPGNNKRPMLSDLRESGSIEQDADMILFLYRDEYYGIKEDAAKQSTIGKAEVIVAKNRNGKGATAIVDFNGAKMLFKDWEDSNAAALLNNQPAQNLIEQSKLEFNANSDSRNPDDDLPF